jgi:5-methylcytosine-specific restriction endonuclease McrA
MRSGLKVRRMKKGQPKLYVLDQQFSLLVRERAKWTCTKCGKDCTTNQRGLHTAHYFGRRNRQVRWDLENVDALCYACHRRFHESPHEYYAWKKKQLGEAGYSALLVRARGNKKINLCDVKQWLNEIKTGIE